LSPNKVNNINILQSLEYVEKDPDPVVDIPLTITNNDDNQDNGQTLLEL